MRTWKKFAAITVLLLMMASMVTVSNAAHIDPQIDKDSGKYIIGSGEDYVLTATYTRGVMGLQMDDKWLEEGTGYSLDSDAPKPTPTTTPETTTQPTGNPWAIPQLAATPTLTVTEQPTPTSTGTLAPTEQPTPTSTGTLAPTEQPTPTSTGTPTPTEQPTPTSTGTPTPTERPTPSVSPDDEITTKVTLLSAYMDTLATGNHELKIWFGDESVVAKINVAEEENPPSDDPDNDSKIDSDKDSGVKTGDDMPVFMLLLLAALSGGATLYFGVKKKYN